MGDEKVRVEDRFKNNMRQLMESAVTLPKGFHELISIEIKYVFESSTLQSPFKLLDQDETIDFRSTPGYLNKENSSERGSCIALQPPNATMKAVNLLSLHLPSLDVVTKERGQQTPSFSPKTLAEMPMFHTRSIARQSMPVFRLTGWKSRPLNAQGEAGDVSPS